MFWTSCVRCRCYVLQFQLASLARHRPETAPFRRAPQTAAEAAEEDGAANRNASGTVRKRVRGGSGRGRSGKRMRGMSVLIDGFFYMIGAIGSEAWSL